MKLKLKFKDNDFNPFILHFNKKKTESACVHKYMIDINSIFITFGNILKKFKLKKKGFKRNFFFVKYIRLYIYKIFLFKVISNYSLHHILIFTPKIRFFINFFLDSFKYSYFIIPLKVFLITNKNFIVKNKKK